VRHRGRTVAHASLLHSVWGRRRLPASGVLEQSINRLSQKVDEGFSVALIHPVPGIGYVLLGDGD
jgi:DNA-binding response OmpR family regulator